MESKLTRRTRTDIVIIFTALIVAGTFGYFEGKHAADRWYARNSVIHLEGSTSIHAVKVVPINPCSITLAEHQEKPWCMDHDNVKWPARIGKDGAVSCYAADKPHVTLIPPIKVRTAAPVTGNLNGAYFSVCSGKIDGMQIGIDQNGKCLMPAGKIFSQAKPVASVEEPR